MPAPVVIRFQTQGIEQIKQAFRSIAQSMAEQETISVGAVQRGSRARLSAAEQEARERDRLAQKTAKDQEKYEKYAAKEAEKASKEATRAFEQEMRRRDSIRDRSATMAGHFAKRMADVEIQEMERSARARERLAHAVSGGLGRGMSQGLAAVGSIAGVAASLGGGFGIADSLQRAATARGMAADLANAGYQPNDPKNDRRLSTNEIMNPVKATSIKYGLQQEDVLGGLGEFVAKTGDLNQGMATMEKLAQLATATGTSFKDMGSAAAEVFNSDTKQSADDLMITMRALAGQGKIGAVEIKDLAKRAALITASAGKFQGEKSENVITLGAIAQEAKMRGGAANAAEASTSVARLADDLAGHQKRFKAIGVETTEGGKLRKIEPLIMETLKATGGDVTKINHLFGVRSARGVQGFAELYRDAEKKEKGSGAAAVEEEFKRLKAATMSEAEVKEAAQKRMEEADKQFEVAILGLRDAVATGLLPELTKLAPKLAEAAPKVGELFTEIGKLVAYFAENPFNGVGAIVGGFMAKEMAAAGIKEMMAKAFSGAGAGGLVIGTAAVAITTGMIAIDKMASDDRKTDTDVVALQIDAENKARRLRTGKNLTAKDIKDAEETQARLDAEIKKGPDRDSTFQKVAGAFSGEEAQKQHQAEQIRAMQANTQASRDLAEALRTAKVDGGDRGKGPGTTGKPQTAASRGGAH